jgi:hypothetical protein
MIRLRWNALRVGHHVLVHDEAEAGMPLVPGRVETVEAAPGSNVVAIRISPARGRSRVVLPSRLAVHLDELDPEARCWRCDARTDDVYRKRTKSQPKRVAE